MLTNKLLKKTFSSFNVKYSNFPNILFKFNRFNFSNKGTKKDIVEADIDSNEPKKETKTIKLIKESIPIKINPYFGTDEMESPKKISASDIKKTEKKKLQEDTIMTEEQKLLVEKKQQKLIRTKAQKKAKTIQVILENIRRDLPKEL